MDDKAIPCPICDGAGFWLCDDGGAVLCEDCEGTGRVKPLGDDENTDAE